MKMRNSKKWIGLLLLTTIAAPAAAHAGEGGSGTRGGGGEVVDPNRYPRLRDLVDKTVCDWVGSEEITAQTPLLKPILQELTKAHWYLAGAYDREIAKLKFCKTANLTQIPTDELRRLPIIYTRDGSEIIPWLSKPKRQKRMVAIRLNHQVFLDHELFMRMPSLDRAMTLIHEAGHSFIPMEWEPPYIWRRNEKLRSLTKGVALTYKERRNSQQFSLFITENDVQIISDTTNLDAARMGVTTLLDRSKSPKERLGAINSIGMPLLNNQLWAGDLYSIRLFLDPYFSKALSAIHAADPHALKQALSVGLNPSFDYGAGSLLSIAGSNADPSILEVLLDWSTPSPNGSTSQTAAINHILLKLLDSELDGVELDFLLDLGADPNALVEANDISGYVTLENALILKGRIDLARILAPAASQTTLRSAFARLTVLNTKESNAFASELLTTKRVSAKAMIEGVPALFFALQAKNPTIAQAILEQGANPALFWNGTNALMWTLIQKRAGVCPECIDAVLADPRTDVNQQDSNGFVAFDYAIAAEQFSLAAKIASQPGFTYDFTPGSGPRAVSNDAVKTHARAVKILNQFALLNQIPAAKSVLAGYPFGFFDLEPIAQRAHQIGYSEMATIIRTAPSFKAREDRPNLAQ